MAEVIIQVAISAIISAAIGGVTKALTADSRDKRDATVNPVQPAPAPVDPLSVGPDQGGALAGLFGHRRIGGQVVLSAKSGEKSYLVIALLGAPVAGFAGVFLNNALVELDGSGNVTSKPWTNNTGLTAINVKLYDGTQTTADPELEAAFPGWTADHVGTNIPYARIILNPAANAAYFNGVLGTTPDFTFGVLGFKCYDPRNPAHVLGNAATYSFSSNVSICRANYLIHRLGMNRSPNLVNWASVAASANIDDELVALAGGGSEPRYTCAAYWTTDQRHEDVISKFNAANGGAFGPIGEKWASSAASFGGASPVPITPDGYSDGGLTFSDWAPIGDAVNGVRGKFTSPIHNYELRDFPAYTDTAARTADAAAMGVSSEAAASWLDLDFEFVTSHSQAQRLARIAYNRARLGHPASVELQFTFFDVVSGDYVAITDDRAGFTDKVFRVTGESVSPDWVVTLSLEHETAAFYAWTAATDEAEFLAEDPLLGDPEGMLPPGAALIDSDAGANTVPNYRLWPSPSSGWDEYVVFFPGTVTANYFPKGTAQTNFTGVAGGTTGGTQMFVRNSVTGARSANPSVHGAVTTTTYANLDEAATPHFLLPAAPSPLVLTSRSGNVQLRVRPVEASRCDEIQLFAHSANDPLSAGLVTTAANAETIVAQTAAPGTITYYWTRARNAATGKVGPFSRATVVVF